MKIKHLIISFILVFLVSGLKSQNVDTLVDIGNQNMHFNIWKGNRIPILFESGGGNDGNIWLNLANEVHSITGNTIITYDRVGYGKSEFNPNLPDNKIALITHGISALETGLNVWDSYGEVLLINGDKEKAKRMYEKSIILNPENDNAKEVLKAIEK